VKSTDPEPSLEELEKMALDDAAIQQQQKPAHYITSSAVSYYGLHAYITSTLLGVT